MDANDGGSNAPEQGPTTPSDEGEHESAPAERSRPPASDEGEHPPASDGEHAQAPTGATPARLR